jgi:hypothetical protein
MTIEQEDIIDIVGVNEQEQIISLYISDHLEWDDKNEKLLLLQNKINTYLAYIESGQIYEQHPDSKNLEVHIHLSCKYEPNSEAIKFLNLAKPLVEEAGYYFNWGVFDENS